MRFFRISVALIVAAALAIGVPSASAATASLSIPYVGCQGGDGRHYDYTLRVEGTTRYYPDGMRVEVRLWGDDEWYDDFLGGPYHQAYESSGFYQVSFCMNRSTLDEDWGRDEIYAGVRVFDASTGKLVEKVESNRINRYF